MTERVEAHRILTEHLPERDRRWLWLRWRCATCGQPYPCLLRRSALAELAAGIRDLRVPATSSWLNRFQGLRRFHRPSPMNRGRW
jgi:hypothetical protein